jgi:signal transduction histidine kinase
MSLKLRTRATLLIAVTFSALLATFLLLTFIVVRQSFEKRTVEEMRSQLRAIIQELPADPTESDVAARFLQHGRTGESPLAITIWKGPRFLGSHGPDTLVHSLPREPLHRVVADTTYDAGFSTIVYAVHHGDYWGAAAMSEHTTDEIIEEMIEVFDLVLVIGVFLSIIVAMILSRFALDPISKLTQATESVLRSGSASRLPVPSGPQEAEVLAQRFNDILQQRDDSIDTLKHFTADVAHELRSPLTILRGELEVELRSGDATPSQRETLESSLEEVKHLSGIVDDLLYIARLENVNDSFTEIENVILAEQVENTLQRLSTPIANKELSIHQRVDPALIVDANPAHIARLLYNLILNATQYSHQHGMIDIYSEGRTLIIKDTGIGIAPEALAHVTERFYRADASRNRGQGNVGLGLAIAHGIARRYDIEMKFESEPGRGTSVKLFLPHRSKQ